MKKLFVSTLVAATAMAVPAFADDLTWGGNSGDSWTTDGVWSSGNWVADSGAIFTTTGAGTVNVTDSVTASSVTIESGASYTFNISADKTLTTGTLTNSGSLALTGSGKIVTGASSNGTYLAFNATSFTGNLTFTEGWFDVANSTLNSDMTVTITANTTGADNTTGILTATDVSIHLGNASESSNTTFAANLVLDGEGGVIIRTHSATKTITFSGSVTGKTATLQSNGGGSVVFAGTVDLGTYIAYQGATTFSGSSTTLGTLELAYDGSATSSVTFSGSGTGASVTSLTTETANTAFTGSLTVSDGATLTVESVSLSSTGSIEVTTTGDTNGTLTVTGNITTEGGTFKINEGSTVTGTGTSYEGLSGTGTFVFTGNAVDTVLTVSGSDFTGTLEVTKGYFNIANTSISDSANIVLHTSGTIQDDGTFGSAVDVSIQYGADGATLANNITLEGSGGVIIRSQNANYTATFSGNISAADTDAAYLQLNGGGSAIFTGTVTLASGGYINYQGTTTFKGATTLGTLEIDQNSDTTSAVIFSGESAQATVGTLTVHSYGSGTDTLTVSDGASLTVDALVINHDVAIAIDNATMSITTSATQTAGTSTSITISNGGQLSVGAGVELNSATINIVLGTDDVASTNGASPTAADSAILTGSGTLGSDVSIAITVDSALANLLGSSEEGTTYTFNIYDSSLTLNTSNIDYSALEQYGTVSIDNGVLTIVSDIPEPELFSVFFGISALGVMATRRRRRRA